MRFRLDSILVDKKLNPYRTLSIAALLLISSVTCVSCFDIGVSPGSICCGDWVTVSISLTNTGNSVFSGRVDIYIIDANGYQSRMDGLSITLQPHESKTFQTRIRPRDCNSYGTYQVVVKLVADNGQEQGTRTSTFVVKDPASCTDGGSGGKQQGCTWTFNCENNIVRRLCINQYGREYWQDYDNCNNYNPPRECINGVCVERPCNPQTCIPPKQCINGACVSVGTCNQQTCQSSPFGEKYSRDCKQYQKYKECRCVDNRCNCEEVEKEIPWSGPDLAVADVSLSKENPKAGEPIEIIATIKNVGNIRGIIDKVNFYLIVDYNEPVSNKRAILIESKLVQENAQLDPGEMTEVRIPWIAVPIYNIKGEHIFVSVDLDKIYKEIDCNGNNNINYKNLNIGRNSKCMFDISKNGYSFSQSEIPNDWILVVKSMIPGIVSDLLEKRGLYGKDPYLDLTKSLDPGLLGSIGARATEAMNPQGACFGMASSSIIYYKTPGKEPTFAYLVNDNTVLNNIFNFHALQYIYFISQHLFLNLPISLDNEFRKATTYIENDEPIILSMWNERSNRHSVVAFDYYEDENNKNLVVYDPNYPGMARVASFKNKFQYKWDDGTIFTSEMIQEPILSG